MLIRQAESELKRMSNKVRFILAVVDGELSIGRKKKSVLVEELETLGFDKMPKTQKGAAAAAQEAMDGEIVRERGASEPSAPATTTCSPCPCGTSPRRRWTSCAPSAR